MWMDKLISSEGAPEGKGAEERQERVCLSFTDLGESLESPQRCDGLIFWAGATGGTHHSRCPATPSALPPQA